MSDDFHKALSILRFKQALVILNISKSNVYDRLSPKSPRYDPSFPKPLKLGPRSVGFIESEIQDWLHSRASAR